MARKLRFDGGDDHNHGDNGHHGHGDDHGHHGDDDNDFNFDFPDQFKIDLQSLDLTKLGKITDFDVSPTELSVTFGKKWTFEVTGSDFDITLKGGHKLPVINSGTIDSFSIDGPGKADFSISGLDMDAKDFVTALAHLQTGKLLDLVLGGDETISGSGFNDFLFGGKGKDTILGNDGADRLLGGSGADIITGGAGGDLLIGGDGADTFVFAPKSGMDLVVDFDPDADKLDLTAYGFSDLSDVISDHGGCHGRHFGGDDVVLDLGNGSMVKLLGVHASDLTTDNVLL